MRVTKQATTRMHRPLAKQDTVIANVTSEILSVNKIPRYVFPCDVSNRVFQTLSVTGSSTLTIRLI